MLTSVEGYYNGINIVTDEKLDLRPGQKVIITILNDVSLQKRKGDLSQYMGKGKKMFHGNVDQYVGEFRGNDRI